MLSDDAANVYIQDLPEFVALNKNYTGYTFYPVYVIDVAKKKYDILVVDEAHRLHQYKNISYMGPFKRNCEKLGLTTESDELDWILKQSECVVLFYDAMQVVGPSGIDFERFDRKMPGPSGPGIFFQPILNNHLYSAAAGRADGSISRPPGRDGPCARD